RLIEHGYEGTGALEICPRREGLPRRISLHACALLEVNEQQLFAKFRMTDLKLLSYPHDRLIQAQSGFQANGEQVQAVRQAQPYLFAPPVGRVGKPQIRDEEAGDESDKEEEDGVAAEHHCCCEAENCGKREPHTEKDVGVVRLAIPCEQQTADDFRVWLCG